MEGILAKVSPCPTREREEHSWSHGDALVPGPVAVAQKIKQTRAALGPLGGRSSRTDSPPWGALPRPGPPAGTVGRRPSLGTLCGARHPPGAARTWVATRWKASALKDPGVVQRDPTSHRRSSEDGSDGCRGTCGIRGRWSPRLVTAVWAKEPHRAGPYRSTGPQKSSALVSALDLAGLGTADPPTGQRRRHGPHGMQMSPPSHPPKSHKLGGQRLLGPVLLQLWLAAVPRPLSPCCPQRTLLPPAGFTGASRPFPVGPPSSRTHSSMGKVQGKGASPEQDMGPSPSCGPCAGPGVARCPVNTEHTVCGETRLKGQENN